MKLLENKIALITGAGRGIGRVIAEQFAQDGATVYVNDLQIGDMEKMCGGFIWEWCDHAIDMGKTIEGKKMYAYGGDHNEYPHDGNFCMDGLVYPDRTPHTGLMEFKNVYRPVRVTGYDAEKGTLTIKNYMNFVNLKDYAVLGYEVLVDGEVTESGKITDEALLELAAGCEKTIPLAISVPEQGKCALKVTWYLFLLPAAVRPAAAAVLPALQLG